ncbi:hypothetical protein GCM10010466_44000 [Planomonospora alba]|uniref:Uncharacterized protein n=1 Tax=Planomonospora alba TaxID=161354 RepID=A0ABP6NJB4_9ACTN
MGRTKRRAAAAALAALVLAGAACGGEGGGGDGEAGPIPDVTPDDSLVPTRGGEDIPAVAAGALKECDRRLRAGENAPLAASMDKRASMTSQVTLAVCRACGGTAKVNLERYREGLADLRTAEELREYFPGSVHDALLEMTLRAQVRGYVAVGDEARARQALTRLVRLDPAAADAYIGECEAARPPGSRLQCEVPVPQDSPETSTVSPSPQDTPTGEPETAEPETTEPGTPEEPTETGTGPEPAETPEDTPAEEPETMEPETAEPETTDPGTTEEPGDGPGAPPQDGEGGSGREEGPDGERSRG